MDVAPIIIPSLSLCVGDVVEVCGLQRACELNGRWGCVVRLLAHVSKCEVKIDGSNSVKLMKLSNLKLKERCGLVARWQFIRYSEHEFAIQEEDEMSDSSLNAACLSWSPCGEKIAVSSLKSCAGVYNVSTRAEVNRYGPYVADDWMTAVELDEFGQANSICWSPDCCRVALGISDYGVRILNADLSVVQAVWTCDGADIQCVDWSRDGVYLAAAGSLWRGKRKCIWVFNMTTAKEVELSISQLAGESCSTVAWNPSGTMIATVFYNCKGIKLLSANTWSVVSEICCDFDIGSDLVWHPAGEQLIALVQQEMDCRMEHSRALLWKAQTETEWPQFQPFGADPISRASWSPTGDRFAFLSNNCQVKIMDANTRHVLACWSRTRFDTLRVWSEFEVTAWSFDCNPSWTLMAIGYDDGVVEVYDMRPPVVHWMQVRLLAIAIKKPNTSCKLSMIPLDMMKHMIEEVSSYLPL